MSYNNRLAADMETKQQGTDSDSYRYWNTFRFILDKQLYFTNLKLIDYEKDSAIDDDVRMPRGKGTK